MPSWKKMLTSGSDAALNSLEVSTSVTAQNFTGSFTGSLSSPGSDGQLLYNNGGTIGAGSDLYYDDVNGNVGIGTTNPSQTLTISGSISASGAIYDNIGSPGTSGQVIQSTGTGYNWTSAITASSLQITGGTGDEGTFTWNSTDNTVDLQLNDTTLQLGQELFYHVINQSGNQINNGEVVYVTGVSSGKLSVLPYSSSLEVNPDLVLGISTEDIPNNSQGFITKFGNVRDIDTSDYPVGTILYSATGSSGYTDTPPIPPNSNVFLGFVTNQSPTEGSIYANVNHNLVADEVKTNLSGSSLISTNVQSALLELDATKASVDLLSSNIVLYPTTGSSPIPGYSRMVTDIDDPDYNITPVDITTPTISGSNQLVASLASDENLIVGNPGIINITTVGSIRKVSGAGTASFYFEIYLRRGINETLVGTSNNTVEVTSTAYVQFDATSLLNNGTWIDTDRIVIKYYSSRTPGGSDPVYQFQFGGDTPVRTLLPVPVSVIPSSNAEGILTDTSNFNNILSGADSDVQKALDTLDDHSHSLQQITSNSNITTDRIIVGNLTVDTDVLYTSGSRVGIGTVSPSEALTVQGNISGSGNLYLNTSLLSTQENTDVDTGTETIATIPTGSYDAAFFDYVIKNGTNLRAGTVYTIHDTTNVEFTETSTQDLGNTTDVTLSVDISGSNLRLLATTTSDNWVIKTLIRAI